MSFNKYDIYTPPEGHFKRFQIKIKSQDQPATKSNKLKWYFVAASLALLISLWYNFTPLKNTDYKLTDVSEQMKETQDYFSSVIHSEIKKVNLKKNTTNTAIINDALHQVEKLDIEYVNLSNELKKNGFEKQVVNAIIFNYQQRIKILQDLLTQIENLKTIKNENNIQV